MSRTGTDSQFAIDMAITPGEVDFTKSLAIVTNPRIKIGAITFIDLVALTGAPIPLPERDGQTWIRVTPERCQLLITRRYIGDTAENFDFQEAALNLEAEIAGNGDQDVIGLEWTSILEQTNPA